MKGLFAIILLSTACTFSHETDHTPPGWFLSGGQENKFKASVDPAASWQGKASARLEPKKKDPDGFATLMQYIEAGGYTAKRVRFSAWVKNENVTSWTFLWMRVDCAKKRNCAFDNMESRPIVGSNAWKNYSVVLDVPADANGLGFGISQDGNGVSWMSDARLEEVGLDTPVTARPLDVLPLALANADFEAKDLQPWLLEGAGRQGFSLSLVSTARGGGHAALLERSRSDENGFATLTQTIAADNFAGKRVRARAFVRSEKLEGNRHFWLRARDDDSPIDGPGLATMTKLLEKNADYTAYETVMIIPPKATKIDIGAGITGGGRLWVDDVSIEIVDASVPLDDSTLKKPRNMDFSETTG